MPMWKTSSRNSSKAILSDNHLAIVPNTMNNVFVYCEIDKHTVEEVSFELLTKGRKLANELGVQLEAIAAGHGITGKVEKDILSYGVDKLHVFDAEKRNTTPAPRPEQATAQEQKKGTGTISFG